MSDVAIGYPTVLEISDTAVGNIISISGANQTREMVDKSTMDSTSKFREKIPGMLDAGDMTIEVNYDGAATGTANDLNNALVSTATALLVEMIFTDPDAATSEWQCYGQVTGVGFAAAYDDKVTQSVTISFTGVPTFTKVA